MADEEYGCVALLAWVAFATLLGAAVTYAAWNWLVLAAFPSLPKISFFGAVLLNAAIAVVRRK